MVVDPSLPPSGYGQWPFIFDLLTMLMVETIWRTVRGVVVWLSHTPNHP